MIGIILKRSRKRFSVIHHFPGAIILLFGMLALHSSVALIDTRQKLRSSYDIFNTSVSELHDDFHDLEETSNQYLNEGKKDFARIQEVLKNVNDRFLEMHGILYKNLEWMGKGYNDRYEHLVYEISQHLAKISKQINEMDSRQSALDKKDIFDLYTDLQTAEQAIDSLQQLIQTHFLEDALFGKIEGLESLLYWSVIAMGFAGFVLAVLNSDKLRQLRKLNVSRRENLEAIQKHISALDMAHDGILIIDQFDCLSYLNKSFCRLYELDPRQRDTYIGKKWLSLFRKEDAQNIRDRITPDLLLEGRSEEQMVLTNATSEEIYVEMIFKSLPSGGAIGTIRDISESKKSEREKALLEEQFFQAQKMEAVGRLAGGIAHDFNNILAAMNGNAEFLIEDLDKDSPQNKFAQNILSAGQQARNLVDQLLAFSRKGTNLKEEINLVGVGHEVGSMLKATLPKAISFSERFHVDEAFVSGNSNQILQLLLNLCVNAQDAIDDEHGEIILEIAKQDMNKIMVANFVKPKLPDSKKAPAVSIRNKGLDKCQLVMNHLAKGREYFRITVKDTGTGMDRNVLEHIFEPFFTTKDVNKGTGLGMATVMGVIVSHEGALLIDTKVGEGTVFDIYLPLPLPLYDAEHFEEEEKLEKASMIKDLSKRRHVLLVDDQDDVRIMMEENLKRFDYDVTSVNSALEALDLIREDPEMFDLVITDHNMPDMTGIEMVQEISPDLPDLPFVIISGYSEESLQEKMKDYSSVKRFLKKPISKDVLQKNIQDVLMNVS
ncbi:MAG: response regulator [Alphaproteobacteria bacterium]|nr:response regulator [Alphaproteobacteria bacterium]